MDELTEESWKAYMLFLNSKNITTTTYYENEYFNKIKKTCKTWEDYISLFIKSDELDYKNIKTFREFLFNRKVEKWLS